MRSLHALAIALWAGLVGAVSLLAPVVTSLGPVQPPAGLGAAIWAGGGDDSLGPGPAAVLPNASPTPPVRNIDYAGLAADAQVQTAASARLEAEIFRRTNERRQAEGGSAVALDPELAAIARAHSRDMAERGFFSTTNPDGLSPTDRVAGAARRFVGGSIGENLLRRPSPDLDASLAGEIVDAWAHNAKYESNLLAPEFNQAGVGVWGTAGEVFVTMLLGARAAQLVAPVPLHIAADAPLDFAFTGTPAPVQVGLRPSRGPSGIVYGPVDLVGDAGPRPVGDFGLVFYVPEGNRHQLLPGPEIAVD